MKHLFLSPHYDDAVWSCGGILSELKKNDEAIQVLTIFGGEANDLREADPWRRVANSSIRRLENERAMQCLDVEHVSLGYCDAALRQDNNFNYLYSEPAGLLKDPHPEDSGLIKGIVEDLTSLFSPGDQIYVPLALNAHVDHRLTRKAVESLAPSFLNYYADFPYIRCVKGLEAYSVNLFPFDVDAWLKASLCYRSQVIYLFKSQLDFQKQLKQFILNVTTENDYAQKIWKKT